MAFNKTRDEISAVTSQMKERARALSSMAHLRAVKELRELEPNLPEEGCLHYAHNWLVCRPEKGKVSRQARFIIDRFHRVSGRAYKLVDQYWSRKYQEMLRADPD